MDANGCWSPPETGPEVFEAMAKGFEVAAPEAAAIFRRCAADELALSLLPSEPTWDTPHRLLAAARVLVLRDEVDDFEAAADPWVAFRAVLEDRQEWLARFVRERTVQTNEVQRCWALLPLFLTVASVARRPLDLLELGTSAGLNLLWDRYGYRFETGRWGDDASPLQLGGTELAGVPRSLLETDVEVRTRRGIDLSPVDATSVEGLVLLKSFVRDDGYRTRLEHAAQVLRADPPELICGNYLDVLPDLLRGRSDDSLTVVFQTHSTVYLTEEERLRVRAMVTGAGADGPLAWISTPTPDEHGRSGGDYPLELAIWPGGTPWIAARTNVRGEWLDWIG